MKKQLAAILFLDVKGYSKLTEQQLNRFFDQLLPRMAALLNVHELQHVNTWGDAVVAISLDPLQMASTALELRDLFLNFNWNSVELPNLALRISLHAGHIYTGLDPFRKAEGVVGTQVNLAARIEPVTLPGHVWATDTFISLLRQESQESMDWDDLGERPLAKNWGAKHLFRVRRKHESSEMPSLSDDNGQEARVSTSRKIDLLKTLLAMGDERQKMAALDVIAKIDSPESLAILMDFVKRRNESTQARVMAIASIVEMKSEACVPDLIAFLRDSEESVSIAGAISEALGKLGDSRSFEVLADIAQSDDNSKYDSRVRGTALQSLSRLRDPRAIPIIRSALASDSPEVVGAALGAAGLVGSKGLTDALIGVALSKDKHDPTARSSALEAIVLAGRGPMPSIFDSVKGLALDTGEYTGVRRPAILLLAMFEHDDARNVLFEIAGRLDDELSPGALLALFGGEDMADKVINRFKKTEDD